MLLNKNAAYVFISKGQDKCRKCIFAPVYRVNIVDIKLRPGLGCKAIVSNHRGTEQALLKTYTCGTICQAKFPVLLMFSKTFLESSKGMTGCLVYDVFGSTEIIDISRAGRRIRLDRLKIRPRHTVDTECMRINDDADGVFEPVWRTWLYRIPSTTYGGIH